MPEAQNYQNHVRQMPGYVVAVFFILLANIIWSGYRMAGTFSVDSVLGFLVAVSIVMVAFISRTQTLTVQNRVIRLEQRLRFREILASDVAAKASQLPIPQLMALRFASDGELPTLVNEVLAGQVTTPKDIKMKVKQWEADHLRA